MASKVFIVTGASKGLGAAIVQHLLAQSHKVVVTARSETLLQKLKEAHPTQIAERLTALAVNSFGKLDGVVINHGVLEPKRFADESVEDTKRFYDVNLFSYVAMARASLKEVKKTKGCIVWVSSGAALKAYQAWSTYGSAKAAVNSMAAHLAVEEPDITSVSFGPGRVNTDMQAVIREKGKDTMEKAMHQNFVDALEQGELLRPEQPGNVIAKFVANPLHKLSGQYINWNSPELADYQS
ncbi:uncharacterized oxidoreductase C30D10.05c [Trichoderma asperellum]|uniref:Uncharacterized oxidoreductase C30D10.05c n=1 Tax=Trichoderma asperellum TaxID=101201 RepID=A0A6V8QZC9_TRIAP|nr:hypothetical protein LI328DRAFT_142668 [Trichoderma asperelloides]GFP57455.1 uncharacterized oxidoreductase C30D10.05c [Trichoderma asperellum]